MSIIDELAKKYGIFDRDMPLFKEAIQYFNVATIKSAENIVLSLHRELDPDIDLTSIMHDPIKMLIANEHIREIFQDTAETMPEQIALIHGSDVHGDKILQAFKDLSLDQKKEVFSICLKEASDNLFSLPVQEEMLYEPDRHHMH